MRIFSIYKETVQCAATPLICALTWLMLLTGAAGQNQTPTGSPSASQRNSQEPASAAGTAKPTPPPAVHKKKRRRKTQSPNSKVVIRNGSAPDPSVQFSTAATPAQASHERAKTDGLLATTNSNIQKLSGHDLNANQQDTLKQVHAYMEQAKTAEAAGDFQGAENLALKAQLLSSELDK